MKKVLSIAIILLLAAITHAQDLQNLDGNISSEEANSLKVIGENENNQLMIGDLGDYLRIAVKSEELYVASLCICNDQNEVIVLHASAALGQIVYKRDGGKWTTGEKFDWQMRETGMDASTIAKRTNYLEVNGWVANTMRMGAKGETEFILDRKLFSGDLKLAIGLMTAADPENIVGVPYDIEGCATHSLVAGPPNSTYKFLPDRWIIFE